MDIVYIRLDSTIGHTHTHTVVWNPFRTQTNAVDIVYQAIGCIGKTIKIKMLCVDSSRLLFMTGAHGQ